MTDIRALEDFTGRWRVSRHITPDKGPAAVFEGEAVWSEAQRGLAYREAGTMTLDGHQPMQAERQYFWDNALKVYFADGRFFHQVPAGGGATAHWCDPDQYDGVYDFSEWPGFSVSWTVQGPRKAYRSVTFYERC